MKNIIWCVFIFFNFMHIFADVFEMQFIGTLPEGRQDGQIEFSEGPYLGEAPHDFAFIDGRNTWIAQTKDAAIVDMRTMELIRKVPYPNSDKYAAYKNGYQYIFYEDWSASARIVPVISRYTEMYEAIEDYNDFRTNDVLKTTGRPYIKEDKAFYYNQNGEVFFITKDGVIGTTEEAIQYMLHTNQKSFMVNDSMRSRYEELIKNGKFLIIEGIVYPYSGVHFIEFLNRMGYNGTEINLLNQIKDNEIRNIGFNGDIYIGSPEGIVVYSQKGEQQAIIDVESIKPWGYNEIRTDKYSDQYYAIHSNGDLYSVYVAKGDKAYFYKAEKNWGIDYMKMSREGIGEGEEEKTRELLYGMNNRELSVIRNGFFALQGYNFKSWELKCYFNGYEWYAPNEEVKSDIKTLSERQRRLYELIAAEEGRRK